jgi:hypothetical protein
MSYDLVKDHEPALRQARFRVVIADESHLIKNSKSERTSKLLPVLQAASRVLLLTGTPALSRPAELFTQISAIDRSFFPNFRDFAFRYCNGKQMPWGMDASGSSHARELHLLLTERLMIRRLKGEVLAQLPPKRRVHVFVHGASAAGAASAPMRTGSSSSGHSNTGGMRSALGRISLEAFQAAAVAKQAGVEDFVEGMLRKGEKILVFAHHTCLLDAVSAICEYRRAGFIRIDGSTSVEDRAALVERFQRSTACRVAVLSLTAANAGLTLTASHIVVFAELYWNPGVLCQAEDRVHRLGQKHPVDIFYLLCRHSIDDLLWPLLQRKVCERLHSLVCPECSPGAGCVQLDVLSQCGMARANDLATDPEQMEYSSVRSAPSQKMLISYFEHLAAELEQDSGDTAATASEHVAEHAPDKQRHAPEAANAQGSHGAHTIDSDTADGDGDVWGDVASDEWLGGRQGSDAEVILEEEVQPDPKRSRTEDLVDAGLLAAFDEDPFDDDEIDGAFGE